MTINAENPSRMVLQDKKYNVFLSACAVIALGLVIICLFARHSFIPVFVGLAFMGAGAFILFRTRQVTIELDKTAGTIHILLQGLKSKEERNLGMAQIQKVLLRKFIQTHTMRSSSGRGFASTSATTTYHRFILVFVTNQNEEIQFDFGKIKIGLMNMLTSPEEKIRQRAQEIANFLNVPMDVAAPPSASDVVGAIRNTIVGRLQKVH
jgi:hypothetical protein